jgi:hypothetical protein
MEVFDIDKDTSPFNIQTLGDFNNQRIKLTPLKHKWIEFLLDLGLRKHKITLFQPKLTFLASKTNYKHLTIGGDCQCEEHRHKRNKFDPKIHF